MTITVSYFLKDSERNIALQGMGDDFIAGYTSLVDSEKDPRNLMIAFSIDRVICIEFDISHHTEVSAHHLVTGTKITIWSETIQYHFLLFSYSI